MVSELERRHKNLYHTISREEFAAAVAALDARIPTLKRHQIIVQLMRLAVAVNDGHTNVHPQRDPKIGFRSLPLRLYLFDDGLHVRAAAPEHAGLVGAKVEAIGGVPVTEAIRRVSAIISRDNEVGVKPFVPIYLAMPEIQNALGLSTTTEASSLTLRKGNKKRTVEVPNGEVLPPMPSDTDTSLMTPGGWVDARASAAKPLWLVDALDLHRMVPLPDRKALYIQLNEVGNEEGQTLEEFASRIAAEAKATNPERIVVDLRLARGGSGELRIPFFRELIKAEDEDTALYPIIGRSTFSATQFIANDLDEYTEAVFVGEPTGSSPVHYGDSRRITLPNSGITVRASTLWHQRGARERLDWIAPDVAAPLNFADYTAGRDPALEAALTATEPEPLNEQLSQAIARGGLAEGLRLFDTYVADPKNAYADVPFQTALAGYGLFNQKRPQDAVKLIEHMIARYSGSADAHYFLADTYALAKDRERANAALDAALRIDRAHADALALKQFLARSS